METENNLVSELASDPVLIGEWTFYPDILQLARDDKNIKLEPRIASLLFHLTQNAGHPVSRDILMEKAWPGMVVGDEALTSAINKLRKAFGDDSHHPEVIETIPKVGYRLIADVKYLPSEKVISDTNSSFKNLNITNISAAIGLAILLGIFFWFQRPELDDQSITPLPNKPSIAVLPFTNMSNDAEQEYFADGMTEDLITDLSKISGLFVISRNSVFTYKGKSVKSRQVAEELAVRYVLEGSVRRSGNQVRINIQLIDATTGGHIWADRYDGTYDDIFALQDKVTSKIVATLAVKLTEGEQDQINRKETENTKAYDSFLKGWEQYRQFTRESFYQAELHFQKALDLDPDYSRAHAALALIYWKTFQKKWHKNRSSTLAGWAQARRELEKSMSNPTPLAYSLQSTMHLYNRRYEDAISEAQRAIALNPNNPVGYLALADVLVFSGQSLKAIEMAIKATRLDPNYAAPYLSTLGLAHYNLRNFDEAEENLQRSIAINPKDQTPYLILIATYGQLGQKVQATVVLEQLNELFQQEYGRHFSIDWFRGQFPFRENFDNEHFLEGLKKAGAPEW